MLVFTRKRDQSIIIGDGVEVKVLRIGRDTIRLGVTAPPSVAVHRGEVYDEIKRANAAAAAAASMVTALVAKLRHEKDADERG